MPMRMPDSERWGGEGEVSAEKYSRSWEWE